LQNQSETIISANQDEIREILSQTRTIAVVGLSPKPEKESHQVAKYLQEAGYRIIPVYPKEGNILGERSYRSLVEVPAPVDMVDIFRKPEHIPAIVDQALARNDIKFIWTQIGLINNEAAPKAQAAGRLVVQNRCTKIEHRRLLA
jgi:predicted CoA-binding protein